MNEDEMYDAYVEQQAIEAAERERQCNFKIGDVVKATSEEYVFTCASNNWVGVVTEIDEDGYFDAITITADSGDVDGSHFGMLFPSDFELVKQVVP